MPSVGKAIIFSSVGFLSSLLKIIYSRCVNLFLKFPFSSIGLSTLFHVTVKSCCFSHYSFAVCFEIRYCSFVLLLEVALDILSICLFLFFLPVVLMNFRMVLSVSMKNAMGILIGIIVNP